MANKILLKRSSVANTQPTTGDLSLGELAINTNDGRLYTKIDNGTPSIFDLTQNQPITLTGNITGVSVNNTAVGNTSIVTTLSTTGVAAGTYGGTSGATTNVGVFTVDQYGRITGASNTAISTASLANGTSNIQVLNNGNITFSVAGTSNVGVVASNGLYITGIIDATGNIVAANVNANGDVSGATLNISGNANVGNLGTAGLITATGNITGGNLNTSGRVQTANIFMTGAYLETTAGVPLNVVPGGVGGVRVWSKLVPDGNITRDLGSTTEYWSNFYANTANINATVIATGNITGGNLITGGVVDATGNVTGGNLTTAGRVDATGNITGGNVIAVSAISAGTTVTATGNVTGGNITTAGQVDATGNITGGNLTTSGTANIGTLAVTGAATVATTLSVTGNASAGNLNTAGLVAATGNVSGGNLTTTGRVDAIGNVSGGNITTAGVVQASGNIIAPNIVTSTVTTSSGDLILNSAGGALQWDGTGNIIMNSQWINNLADPVAAYDAATKQYVDDAVSTGITIHTPVYVEAPIALPAATYAQGGTTATVTDTIAGNTVVFSSAVNPQVNDQLWFTSSFSGIVANTAYFVVSAPNTSAAVLSTAYDGAPVSNISNASGLTQAVRINSGVGATLTANTNGQLTVDGVQPTVSQRILVYNQTPAYENGVYVVTQTGNVSAPWILTRSSDTNTYGPKSTTQLDAGDYFYVQAGNTGAGESYVMTAPTGTFIIGYNNLTFTQFSASQVYTANTAAGIDLTGTVFSAKVDDISTAFDGSGNIVVKPGAVLTTPNIGAATGTSLSVTGNVSGGNLVATANVSGGNVIATGIVSATGNVSGGNLTTTGRVDATGNVAGGNVTTTGQVAATGNITGGNLITVGIVSATGNITGGNLNATGLSLTGNVVSNLNVTGNVAAPNVSVTSLATGQIAIASTGGQLVGGPDLFWQFANSRLFVTNIDSNGTWTTSGPITATGNVTGGNLNTGAQVIATGNITGGNLITSGLASVTGNITGGNLTTSGTANVATIIVTTLANITATTAATSTTSGALQVAGGVGVVGNVYAGDVFKGGVTVLNANDTIDGGTY